jgi:hypothetical protein
MNTTAQERNGRPGYGSFDAPEGVTIEIFEKFDSTVRVKITVAAGVELGHVWLRADNAARSWAKRHGNGAKLVRESFTTDTLTVGTEHMFLYNWAA